MFTVKIKRYNGSYATSGRLETYEEALAKMEQIVHDLIHHPMTASIVIPEMEVIKIA